MAKKLDELVAKMNAAREAMRADGVSALEEAFSEFFAAHPEAHAIRWTQYAPGFNDGEPCVFSVNDFVVRVGNAPTELDDEDEDDGADWKYRYSVDDKVLALDLDALETAYQSLSELAEEVIGASVKVTATRAGLKIEDYDCGY
jgi:hypothetical protein